MIINKGFRECFEHLEEKGLYRNEMLRFLNKQQQFLTKDANEKNVVTKVRWVAEAANGQLKNCRALEKVIPNTLYWRLCANYMCAIFYIFQGLKTLKVTK